MDADDVSLEKRFEKQLEFIEKNDIDICGCHYFIVNEQGKYINAKIVPISKDALNINLAYTVPFAHGSVTMKKEILKDYKYGVENFSAVEDYSLWIKMYDDSVKFGNVDEFLFKYRDFPNSFSKTKINKMEKERSNLSKEFLTKYSERLKASIDVQLKTDLSYWEDIYLIRISLLMWYKVRDVSKKSNKKNFIFAFILHMKQKIWK